MTEQLDLFTEQQQPVTHYAEQPEPEQTSVPFLPMPETNRLRVGNWLYWLEWHDAKNRQADDRRLPTVAELQSITRGHAIGIGMDTWPKTECFYWADDGSAVQIVTGVVATAAEMSESMAKCWLVWR